jgi:hypothetical protein
MRSPSIRVQGHRCGVGRIVLDVDLLVRTFNRSQVSDSAKFLNLMTGRLSSELWQWGLCKRGERSLACFPKRVACIVRPALCVTMRDKSFAKASPRKPRNKRQTKKYKGFALGAGGWVCTRQGLCMVFDKG